MPVLEYLTLSPVRVSETTRKCPQQCYDNTEETFRKLLAALFSGMAETFECMPVSHQASHFEGTTLWKVRDIFF
jgi:hypothetical protein